MSDDEIPGLSHVAGVATQYDNRIRQRCQWCGVVIIDQDLSRIGYQICSKPITLSGSDWRQVDGITEVRCQRDPYHADECSETSEFKFAEWTQGKFVFVSDSTNPKAYWSVDWEDGDPVPQNACLRLPAELTGSED